MADRIIPRDDNGVALQLGGFRTQTSLTLDASNETKVEPLFRVTGSIQVNKLYGIVTTTVGANHTAAYWRLNDQTAQEDISLNTGTTVSSAGVGSLLTRRSIATAALVLVNSTAGHVSDPVAATAPDYFMPFTFTQKVGSVNTDIEYVYTTTTEPTTGVIQFFLVWQPLSSNAAVSPQQD